MIEGLPLLAWPRGEPGLTILNYHRVMPMAEAMRPFEADAALFDRQMAFLARHFRVLPLCEAVRALRDARLPARACCVTFDDGYADNLTVALPILERHRLPATVFVATATLDGGRMFNDTVIEFIARSNITALDLRSAGKLGSLGVLPLQTPDDRRAAINAILGVVRFVAPEERRMLVEQLCQQDANLALPDDLMLSTAQVRELAARGIEIGGHTDAHTVLTTLDAAGARAEIARGKTKLEAITGHSVRSFAYPNGRPDADFRSEHVALVRELGFDAAVTTATGVARSGADPMQLPRFAPWGRSVPMLSARLVRNARLGRPAALCKAPVRTTEASTTVAAMT